LTDDAKTRESRVVGSVKGRERSLVAVTNLGKRASEVVSEH
jgi:hypothetical protein